MIALIGSQGSMGKRYQAILDYLGVSFLCFDKSIQSDEEKMLEAASKCDRFIIATPTETHTRFLRALLPLRKPVLCEKPITKDEGEIQELHDWCAENGFSYNMVMQYKELGLSNEPDRVSVYNYFRHGNDGLTWDCIQIIGFARGPVVLGSDSPVWICSINGRHLTIRDMDQAYVDHIKRWLAGALDQSMEEILDMHKRVLNYIEKKTA